MFLLHDFFSLLYPRTCLACENSLQKHENCICTICQYHLPKTNFHKQKENPIEQLFWGKTKIKTATALFYFQKKGKVQKLIHELKYKGRKQVGLFSGEMLAISLLQSERHQKISYVIPVPLHSKKIKKRGYNQSEIFAKGIANYMNICLDNTSLFRTKHTETQTKKSRFDRWKNVNEKFDIKNYEHLKNKDILLVDDVITTGATIEACAQALLKIEGIKVHVASIAFTS